jgi:hypothetical protein
MGNGQEGAILVRHGVLEVYVTSKRGPEHFGNLSDL